jgi:hemerythrin-like domain-containing protein
MSEPELHGPIKNAFFIHRAILTEADYFQETALSLMADDDQGIATVKERLSAFDNILKTHEDSEDLAIFPPLQAKYPYIVETYEFDHRRHRNHGADLTSTLTNLDSARGEQRRDLVKALGEQAIVFNAYMRLHITKENELLFPTYDRLFSIEEQNKHGEVAQGHLPPDAMAIAGAWMFQRLNADDREGFLREMMGMMPPEAIAGLTRGLSGTVPASEWQDVMRRIPELTR